MRLPRRRGYRNLFVPIIFRVYYLRAYLYSLQVYDAYNNIIKYNIRTSEDYLYTNINVLYIILYTMFCKNNTRLFTSYLYERPRRLGPRSITTVVLYIYRCFLSKCISCPHGALYS